MDRSVIQFCVFVGLVAVCFAAAGAGQLFSGGEPDGWYRELRKPNFTPPGWVFSPVWTILYLSMAAAAWLVWRRRGFRGAAGPLVLFAIQLVLNAVWPALFFGLRNPGVAFGEILVLWAAVAVTTSAFFRASLPAGLLMLPYLAWATFAVILNGAIWRLNL